MKILRKTLSLLVVVVSLLFANKLLAQQARNIQNVINRKSQSLNGNWKILIDPFENGYYNYRMQVHKKGDGYFADVTYNDKRQLQEYDFETAKEINVPGDWNTQMPQLYYYEGTIWYRKRFKYKLGDSKKLFLNFGAANNDSRVWLNGEPLGHHVGGYTPFCFEITDKLVAGENSLVVKVDNKRYQDAVPTVNSDWWNYGGITRSVDLIETPNIFIQDYYLQLKKGTKDILEGSIELNRAINSQKVRVEIPELNVSKEYTTDSNGKVAFEIKCKPQLWNTIDPKLYTVNLYSEADYITDEIGFRTIETKGKDIYLNGEKIFCRGVCIHEERMGDSGRAFSAEHDRTLLTWAKEMGCNFVRLAHYPHNEFMVREAEKMGILVWSEIPVYWTISWDNKDTYANAEKQLSDMISRDKNRCNIIIWSIANETPHGDARMKFLTGLATKAREMDNIRLIGAAMEKNRDKKTGKATVQDDLSSILDIISFNQYYGWYGSTPEQCDKINWIFNEDKPVFISEFGGGALYGNHGAANQRFTEEYQKVLYEKQIAMFKRMDGLAGTTPWIIKDFRSPRRQVPNLQDDFNRKGLISDRGEKKQAFFVMREWYKELAKKYKY